MLYYQILPTLFSKSIDFTKTRHSTNVHHPYLIDEHVT